MKPLFKLSILSAVVMCWAPLSATALTADGLINNPVSGINRQVERNAERLLERAATRRAEQQAENLRSALKSLPDSLPVYTVSGQKAFNEVVQEEGFRAVERQWLVTGTPEDIDRLDHPGITVLERTTLSGLGMIVARFRVRPDLDSYESLRKLLPELADSLDRNHVYSPRTGPSDSSEVPDVRSGVSLCEEPVKIGMIDTSVATEHPAFGAARIVEQRFLSLEGSRGELVPVKQHGTAVAGQLVGRQGSEGEARLPGATLFNASVFYSRTDNLSGATLVHLLKGLDWLATQEPSVINISLTGADNRLLEAAVRRLANQGTLLVAAVGNEGPAASPLFPAAYSEVIGVTATSRTGELYRWASRGEHVMFAAHGVAVSVPDPEGGLATESGTSLAAPVVAAALACEANGSNPQKAVEVLIDQARDLGEPGRDSLFGFGFLPY